jgi:Na+-transporting NADH:ubiquinone oxidoreductase subunit NqrF
LVGDHFRINLFEFSEQPFEFEPKYSTTAKFESYDLLFFYRTNNLTSYKEWNFVMNHVPISIPAWEDNWDHVTNFVLNSVPGSKFCEGK